MYFRRDGGPRGDGGNRGGYRESRDENFNRGGGRDRQWNDHGGRDGDRPQRQNNDYQRGKKYRGIGTKSLGSHIRLYHLVIG